MEVECSDPFEREGLEWLVIKIKGKINLKGYSFISPGSFDNNFDMVYLFVLT